MKFLSILGLAASASAAAINARDDGWNSWAASTVTVYSTEYSTVVSTSVSTAYVSQPAKTVTATVTNSKISQALSR